MNTLDVILDDPADLFTKCSLGGWVVDQDLLALAVTRKDFRDWMANPHQSYGEVEMDRIRSAAGKVGWRPVCQVHIFYKRIKNWKRIRRE